MKSKAINPNLNLFPVAAGVWGMKDVFVNLYMVLNPNDNTWVLVDAGLKWSTGKIKRMAQLLFGEGAKPSCIILTHGHFDHVGTVSRLAADWDVPVYAHHLEIPYLTGVSAYPPADPTVGGGLMSDLSFLYSDAPINLEKRAHTLPPDNSVPGLPDWRYLHTPGHSPGHISLFREKDRVLLSGDAVVTTKAESMWFSLLQLKKLSGPPKYYTSDWLSAAASVEEIAKLEPEVLASGHGKPLRGNGLRKSLHNLANHFESVAVPYKGRYIYQPALSDDTGVVHVPPKNTEDTAAPTLKILGVCVAVLITVLVFNKGKKKVKASKELKRQKKLAEKYEEEIEHKKNQGKTQAKKLAEKYEKEIENKKNQGKTQAKKTVQHLVADLKKFEKPIKEKVREVQASARKVTKQVEKKVPVFVDRLESLKFPVKKEVRKLARKWQS